VEHHLIDDTNPNLLVRPAIIDDTPAIAELSTIDLSLSEEALDAAQTIVAERLAVESGDDYFTIVAEDRSNGEIVGWLAGGGSRGQALKGWGELYALSTQMDDDSTLVDEALLAVAVNALRLAQFTGVTTWVDSEDSIRCELFADLGFSTELLEADGEPDTPAHFVRYSLAFNH